MIFERPAFYKHIVHVNLHVSADLLFEDFVHQSLIGGTRVLEAERHDPVAVKAAISDKSSLLFIFRCHSNLVIVGERVHKSEKLMARGSVHQLVDPGKGLAVLWASFIQLFEVDTHPPLAVCFLDQDNIGDPLWIIDLLDESGLEKFIHFLGYRLLPLWGMTPDFFFCRPIFRVDRQMMFHDFCVDPRHIRRDPCKNVRISSEEIHKTRPHLLP